MITRVWNVYCLVHSFYGQVHVTKAMLKGDFIKYMHFKSIYKNVIIFFAPNMLEKMFTCDS